MADLIVPLTVTVVLVLAALVVGMIGVGLLGILSGTRVVVGCPQCGRWRLDVSGRGRPRLCMHCAHPERFSWEPALLHSHRPRDHR